MRSVRSDSRSTGRSDTTQGPRSDVSEARIKASSASRYAEVVTATGQIRVEHLLVLGGDVETCQTLEEVRSAAIKNASFKLG